MRPQAEESTPEDLYKEIKEKIEDLFKTNPDAPHKVSILKNLEEIHSWTKARAWYNKRLISPALQSMKAALAILKTIEDLASEKFSSENFKVEHLFEGGHLLIEDDGFILETLSQHAISLGLNLSPRPSSHYAQEKRISGAEKSDYSFRAELIFNEFLIGTVVKDGHTCTWLQFEGHAYEARSAYRNVLYQLLDYMLRAVTLNKYNLEKSGHLMDYLKYSFLHKADKNIGPYGHSEYTEKNPIAMKKNGP